VANWTGKVGEDIGVITGTMNCMPASHESDGIPGREHVNVADGTVGSKAVLDTLMLPVISRQTNVALLAVKSIDSNALTNPTYLAVRAVIYIFRAVIIVKLAHVAVIVCQTAATTLRGGAVGANRLYCLTIHTQHLLCSIPIDLMVLVLIMADAATVPTLAAISFNLTSSLVVQATQHLCTWIVVRHLTNFFGALNLF